MPVFRNSGGIVFIIATSLLISCSGGGGDINHQNSGIDSVARAPQASTKTTPVATSVNELQLEHQGTRVSTAQLLQRALTVFGTKTQTLPTEASRATSALPAPTPSPYCSIDNSSGQPSLSGPYLDCYIYAGVPYTYQLQSAVTDGLSGVGFTCGPITWNTPVTSGSLMFTLSPAIEGQDAPCGPGEQNVTAALTFTTAVAQTYSVGEIFYTGTFCESNDCTPTSTTGWHAEVPNTMNAGYELTVYATATASPTPCATICYAAPITAAAKKYSVNALDLAAIAAQESGGGCLACGNANAPGGLFQVTPDSGCTVTDESDPTQEANCAAKLFAYWLGVTKGQVTGPKGAFHYYNRGYLSSKEPGQEWNCAPYNGVLSYHESAQAHKNLLTSGGYKFKSP
ncbi:MAG: transglycosylase SLT domain-containing protein [Candidatus Eremiobacteraeota bacterium]|nr:transglycosylase SLT domain-containing protein [Candidatus Eremiobacteraeota bacterium]